MFSINGGNIHFFNPSCYSLQHLQSWPVTLVSTMETLEEDLTCSVCYSLFSDPRVLPCSHTFCLNCLDNLLKVSNNSNNSIWRPLRLPLKCPNCRSVVELPLAGLEALPSNVSLRAIVEKVGQNHPTSTRWSPIVFIHLLLFCLSTRVRVSRGLRPVRSTTGSLSTCTASRIDGWSAACVWLSGSTRDTRSMTCRQRSSERNGPRRDCWPSSPRADGQRWG